MAGPTEDYQRTSPCADHDCRHGVCLATPRQDNGYVCQCDPGYEGENVSNTGQYQQNWENRTEQREQLNLQMGLNPDSRTFF